MRYLPETTITLERDAKWDAIADRHHNRLGKEAMREELVKHHRQRIPGHFRATARAKYGYKPRTARYKAFKIRRYKSRTDLVKTGRTRDRVTTAYRLRMGGSLRKQGGARGISGRLIMRLPFPQSEIGAGSGVTGEDMIDEIGRLTPAEEHQAATGFRDRYVKKINALSAGRRRKRVKG